MNTYPVFTTFICIVLLLTHLILLRQRIARGREETRPGKSVFHLSITAMAALLGLAGAFLAFFEAKTWALILTWIFIPLAGVSLSLSLEGLSKFSLDDTGTRK
jgi:hypothetical protein